jgi:hypothetical protein
MDRQLQDAQRVMMGEGDKVYASAEQRRLEQLKRKDAFTNAALENKAKGFDSLDRSMAFAASSFLPLPK